MSKADFSGWIVKEQWAITDAAMLLVGAEPSGNYPPVHLKTDEKIRYEKIMRAARQDVGDRLPTSWVSKYPGLTASPDNYPYVCVLPGDWIAWARKRKFSVPPALLATAFPQTPSKKQRQEAALELFLQTVKTTAESNGKHFLRGNMPGTKDQFKRLIKAHCPELRALAGNTLDDYMKRAGCRFRPGAKQAQADIWKDLGFD